MQIGTLNWNSQTQLLLISGPCVIESLQLCLDVGGTIRDLCAKLHIPYVFKASFDKANRSSASSYRGDGMEEGLHILAEVRKQLNVPITTDVHESDQCAAVGQVVDIMQIPAFLCRQTDLLLASAATGKPVNVKKGQFMAPWEMSNVVDKIIKAGNSNVMLTERGTFFGYNRLVNDMTGLPQMQALGSGHTPVIFDATHSTQLPGGAGTATAGNRQYSPLLARAAVASGVNGLFIEAHPNPEKSLSDSATIMDIKTLPHVLEECLAIRNALAKIKS